MSAREKLLRVLRGQEEECYCDNPHCTPPEALLDAYAHELAEKIRNSKRLRDYTDDHMSDCNMAADEIDPEVLNSGE